MQYYEYLNIDYTNYKNNIHIAQSGDCIFNMGIWATDQGHELDAIIQVSLDGNIWSAFGYVVLGGTGDTFSYFTSNILGFKMIRLYPGDNSVFNFAISEHYTPINLRMIGP